jgi:CheY-like chemotaxis protein
MRLEDMTPAHVRRAVEMYDRRAWPPDCGKRPMLTAADLEGPATMEALFERFVRVDTDEEQDGFRRYTLRLGNYRYPFMKFVIQEYLVNEEFFFSVDTHDNLDIRPGSPDYEGWVELKEFNRLLKDKIEFDWRQANLPTYEDLRELCEGLAPVEREELKRARILVVDDEKSVALGLRALLEGRGYGVELAFTGEEVMSRLAREPLPNLVLLDYELPGLDGEEVLKRMRSDPRLRDLPVLMATASSIELERVPRVSGFLHKPYPREVLFRMIRRLLGIPAR